MFKVLKIEKGVLSVVAGDYNGSVEARSSIKQPGEYFIVQTFKIESNAKQSTVANNIGSKANPQSASKEDLEGGDSGSQQALQTGNTEKVVTKEKSTTQKAAVIKKGTGKKG